MLVSVYSVIHAYYKMLHRAVYIQACDYLYVPIAQDKKYAQLRHQFPIITGHCECVCTIYLYILVWYLCCNGMQHTQSAMHDYPRFDIPRMLGWKAILSEDDSLVLKYLHAHVIAPFELFCIAKSLIYVEM